MCILYDMDPFVSLWGHYCLGGHIWPHIWNQWPQLLIHVHIAWIWDGHFWQPLRPLHPSNSLRDQIWPQISNKWSIHLHIHVYVAQMVWALLAASEAITTSKQPWRSNLTSDLRSVTPITYLSMCLLLIWYGPRYGPLDSLWGHYSLKTASNANIWPQI